MATELRRRFEDFLTLRRLAPKTQTAYINAVSGLAKYYNQPPDTLSDDQIQQYLLYLIRERQLSWSTCNVAFNGLHCFFNKFLDSTNRRFVIPPRPRQRKLPEILSRQEVELLINSARNIRHRALLMLTYGSGLRVSEVVNLKPHHIDAERMLVRVEQSKGRKDRYTLLSKRSLDELRIYWQAYRPEQWLFYGRQKEVPMAVATAQKIYYRTIKTAGIKKGNGIHILRHCFATHSLEQGMDIYLIKRLLGHNSLLTTSVYMHVTAKRLDEVKSPLDLPSQNDGRT